MRILVTGGAGFIGRHWCRRLMEKKHEVVVLDNLSSGTKDSLPSSIAFIKGDIRQPADIARAFELGPFERIDHFAALSSVLESAEKPEAYFENNVLGTLHLLEACRAHNVPSFLFASSSTVYGRASVLPTPEDAPLSPISNYGASKAAGECYVMSYARTYNFKAYILRLANITGPDATQGLKADLRRKLAKNSRELSMFGDGTQSKSYMDIEDALDALELVLEKSAEDVNVFNICSERSMTVREIADSVCREMGCAPKYKFSKKGRGGWVGDVEDMLLSTQKLHSLKK